MTLRVVKDEKTGTVTDYWEIPFRRLRDENELNNVLKDVDPKDVVLIQKAVDSDSFMPFVYFMIRGKQFPGFYRADILFLTDKSKVAQCGLG
jgi:hypothetical protein